MFVELSFIRGWLMITAVTALMARSLRMDSRAVLNHLARFGLLVAIYIALSCSLAIAARFGAPGLRFFAATVYLNTIFLTLLGIGFFSTTITEEKEEDTLGLMLMAGIGPLGLLLGKSAGRLVQALLLVIVQYPLTLLAVTMGGVTQSQVQAAYIGIIGYMLLLAGGGVLCSTLAPRSRTAGAWMVAALIIYVLVPSFCRDLSNHLGTGTFCGNSLYQTLLDSVIESSIFLQIENILATGFRESPWSVQVIGNSLFGLACFALSWCCFGVAARTPSAETASRGLNSQVNSILGRKFSPGRVWTNPFVWKDFYFVAGGWSMRLVRIGLYTGLFLLSWGLAVVWDVMDSEDPFRGIIGVYQFFLMLALTWDLALVAAGCVHDEIRGQTLASLVMLPRSTAEVFYSKLLGGLLGAYPGFFAFVVANTLGIRNTLEFMEHAPVLFFVGFLLLVPHLAAVYAVWVRWGAVPLAIGTMIGLVTFQVVLVEAILNIQGDVFLNLCGMVALTACAVCHWLIHNRLRRVAERG